MVFTLIWNFTLSRLDVVGVLVAVVGVLVSAIALTFVAFQIRQAQKSARMNAQAANLSSLLALDAALNACRDQRKWVRKQLDKPVDQADTDGRGTVRLAPYLTAFERMGEAIRLQQVPADRAYSSYARHLRELLTTPRAREILLDARGGWQNLTNIIIDLHEWSIGQKARRRGVKPLIVTPSKLPTRQVDEDFVDDLRERASMYMEQRRIPAPRWYARLLHPSRSRARNLRKLDQHIAEMKNARDGHAEKPHEEYLRGLTTARRLIRTGKPPNSEDAAPKAAQETSTDAEVTNER